MNYHIIVTIVTFIIYMLFSQEDKAKPYKKYALLIYIPVLMYFGYHLHKINYKTNDDTTFISESEILPYPTNSSNNSDFSLEDLKRRFSPL